MATFKIPISKQLINLVYYSHGIVLLTTLFNLPLTCLPLLVLVYIVSLNRCIEQHLGNSRTTEIQCLDHQWKLTQYNRNQPLKTQWKNHFIAPWLTILNFKHNWNSYQTIIILPDQLSQSDFCHLRSLLKWKKVKPLADH